MADKRSAQPEKEKPAKGEPVAKEMMPEAPAEENVVELVEPDLSPSVEEDAPPAIAPPQDVVVDPPTVAQAVAAPQPEQRVRVTRNEQSIVVGDAHFTLRAGSTLTLEGSLAAELIQRGYAVAV